MAALNILYDRDGEAEYFQFYSRAFAKRVFFEVVERRGYGRLMARPMPTYPARGASAFSKMTLPIERCAIAHYWYIHSKRGAYAWHVRQNGKAAAMMRTKHATIFWTSPPANLPTKGWPARAMDEIAEKTASSKRMIYYYFGGKDELYRAVLERAYAHIRDEEAEASFESLPADEALTAQIEHTFDYHADHPDFVRLVMNENIHHGRTYRACRRI